LEVAVPRPRAFDEADVVARAREAFAETGFAGTSLDTLLEATGLARQSLDNAFGGKKELFMRAFLSDTAEALEAVEAIPHGSDSPIARIRAQLVAVAVQHGEGAAPPSPFTKAAVEMSAQDAEVASTVAAAFEAMRAHDAACIAEAQAAGEIEAAADAGSLGAYFCAVIEGMETLGRTGVARSTLLDIGLTSLAAVPVTAGRTRASGHRRGRLVLVPRDGPAPPQRTARSTSSSAPGVSGSKPCSSSQRDATRLRQAHQPRSASRSTGSCTPPP
jgi:TetR/AcrR family transcriptional regulator, transcriptional repressor for nem operon